MTTSRLRRSCPCPRRPPLAMAGAVLLGVALGLSTPPAVAAAGDDAGDRDGEPTRSWCGWQTLLVDTGALAAGFVTKNALVLYAGASLGAPIVHWAHGRVGTGFASLGMRLAAPLTVGFVVAGLDRRDVSDGRELETAVSWGVLGGSAIAMAIDAAFLAWKDVPPPPRRRDTWSVEPQVSASATGVSAGIAGTF